jgi:hypothetical protein
MPKGTYRITATRYHESLPKDVLPLVAGKDNSHWGYKVEDNLGKINPSGSYVQLMKNFVIAQIMADPQRTHVSLELCLEDLEYSKSIRSEETSEPVHPAQRQG